MLRRDFIKQSGLALGGILAFGRISGNSINNRMKQEKEYDVIIVGGSYSGLAAGMALGRALRRVLIVDSGNPCNKQTPYSHNFLTNDGKAPAEIAALARAQMRTYDTVTLLDGMATAAVRKESFFEVELLTGEKHTARKLIFATGIKDVLPDIPGFAACWGISVLHCPYCHGYEVRQQKTGIIANGDSGFEQASLISNWTNDLTLYTNGRSTLSVQQAARLQKHNISVVETPITQIGHQDGHLQHIVFADGAREPMDALYARVPFVQPSNIPQALGCELTADGYIKIDAAQKTTVHGVYACGDSTTRMRTVANAVAMGTTAALMLNKELIEESF